MLGLQGSKPSILLLTPYPFVLVTHSSQATALKSCSSEIKCQAGVVHAVLFATEAHQPSLPVRCSTDQSGSISVSSVSPTQ